MAEYSNVAVQTVADNGNILFANGNRACKRGYIQHRDDSGIFFIKGAGCKSIYRVTFNGNITAGEGSVVGPVSIAMSINGEATGNTLSTVTPAAIGDYFSVGFTTYVDIPCGCCVSVSVTNESGAAIDVRNANIIFERVA